MGTSVDSAVIFQRLAGLETEYALRIPTEELQSACGVHSHREGYERMMSTLRNRLPTADADAAQSAKVGVFLGTGGVVWFESLRPTTNIGLIEGATPECRGPRDLLACQRAQDRLLSQAAEEHGLSLLKNCCDARGNVYGAQENYEVILATGLGLQLWRYVTMFLFIPFSILMQIGLSAILIAALLTVPVTACLYFLISRLSGKNQQQRTISFDYWIGRVWRTGWNGVEIPFGGWIASPLLWFIKIAAAPLAFIIWVFAQFTKLGKMQRQMAPFIVSRILFAGAGRIAESGQFQLSDKAGAINALCGIPEFSRPIFSFGQFVKPCVVLVRISEVFNVRQRIQISIGDSNLCEEAEYLRIGTTMLVIDAIEAGALPGFPKLNAVKALKVFNNDPTLTAAVKLNDGQQMTALQIQRWYLENCRAFVDSQTDPPDDAIDILNRWEEVLDLLARNPSALIGRMDWITKQYLLKETASTADKNVAKKVDLKYHDLSETGYFQQLQNSGLHQRVLNESEVERAMRLPPPGTPANTRARLIREYAGSNLLVGWKRMSNGMRIE